MKNGRNTMLIKPSGHARALYVERELTDSGWRVATSDHLTNEVLIEESVSQRESRETYKEHCRRALEIALA